MTDSTSRVSFHFFTLGKENFLNFINSLNVYSLRKNFLADHNLISVNKVGQPLRFQSNTQEYSSNIRS